MESKRKPLQVVLSSLIALFIMGSLILLVRSSNKTNAFGGWTLPPGPYLNISRQDYEDALAKWKTQNVEEYEIVTHLDSFAGGIRTVRVGAFGKTIQAVTDYNSTAMHTLDPSESSYYMEDTVEGMFAQVSDFLGDKQPACGSGPNASGDFCFQRKVVFDPIMGYPRDISSVALVPPDVIVDGPSFERTVVALKVLKRETPDAATTTPTRSPTPR